MSTIVHYVKHWDNDTKGVMEIEINDLVSAISAVREHLVRDAVADGAITEAQAKSSAIVFDVATITKAEVADGVQAWTGVPVASF